jgi:hypothetical protein
MLLCKELRDLRERSVAPCVHQDLLESARHLVAITSIPFAMPCCAEPPGPHGHALRASASPGPHVCALVMTRARACGTISILAADRERQPPLRIAGLQSPPAHLMRRAGRCVSAESRLPAAAESCYAHRGVRDRSVAGDPEHRALCGIRTPHPPPAAGCTKIPHPDDARQTCKRCG